MCRHINTGIHSGSDLTLSGRTYPPRCEYGEDSSSRSGDDVGRMRGSYKTLANVKRWRRTRKRQKRRASEDSSHKETPRFASSPITHHLSFITAGVDWAGILISSCLCTPGHFPCPCVYTRNYCYCCTISYHTTPYDTIPYAISGMMMLLFRVSKKLNLFATGNPFWGQHYLDLVLGGVWGLQRG